MIHNLKAKMCKAEEEEEKNQNENWRKLSHSQLKGNFSIYFSLKWLKLVHINRYRSSHCSTMTTSNTQKKYIYKTEERMRRTKRN